MFENSNESREWQQQVIRELGVPEAFNAETEREKRIAFLSDYLRSQELRTYVLGISGGVDSSAAGRLAQLSVERLRTHGYNAQFVAVRLPYGSQRDEEDAQLALRFVSPDETLTVDIQPPSDAMLQSQSVGARSTSTIFTRISCSEISKRVSGWSRNMRSPVRGAAW
jgi:NAD+ synthase